MSLRTTAFVLVLLGLSAVAGAAHAACEDGQVLRPGEDCEVKVKWGYDHWVKAEFPQDGVSHIEFSHIEGKCNVSLFGPLEGAVLGPDQGPVRSTQPGEYHLFTRAMTIAQEACRYRITVD
jgi:hypothetical protein